MCLWGMKDVFVGDEGCVCDGKASWQSWFLRIDGKDLEGWRGRKARGTQGGGEQIVKYLEETSCWKGPEVEDQSVEGLEYLGRDFGPCALDKDG